MDSLDSSRIINSARLSFIRQFTLPNFIDKYEELNPHFKFLASSNDYAQYYEDLESRGENAGKVPIEIPNFGRLEPIRKKHSLNSYWKSIRLTLKTQEKRGKASTELFLLMPLKISFPIEQLHVDGIKIPVSVYLYLFPFGSCCFNMDVSLPFSSYSFDDLSNLSKKILKGAILKDKIGSFEAYSLYMMRALNKELFGDGLDVIPFSTHSLIFIEQTSEAIIAGSHKYEIVALMERLNISDVSGLTEENIDKKILCRLNKYYKDEILYFNVKSTFVCPSRVWSENMKQEKGRKKSRKKLQCMCNNYQSFLNVMWAVNRFLVESFLENKNKLPANRVLEITKCLIAAFPELPADKFNKFYYRHAYEQISKYIGLGENLKRIKATT